MERKAWIAVLLIGALWGAACASTDSSAARESWADEAIEYFDSWAHALTDNDFYGVLDFYAPGATVEDRTGIFRDTTPSIRDLLRGNRAELTRDLLSVHLGAGQAVTLVRWPDFTTEHGAILIDLVDGVITRETVFLDTGSLARSLRASPEVIAAYNTLYEEYADAWSSGDGGRTAGLYAPGALVRDALTGTEVTGPVPNTWTVVSITDLTGGEGRPVEGPALFIDPVEYGADPRRAVGIFDVRSAGGCTIRTAVYWNLAGGAIISEDRYPEAESYRRCESGELTDGWWTGLGLPGPRDLVVTGEIETPTGRLISIHNGTPALEELVRSGLEKFTAAGLTEPQVDSVTFEPTRRCQGVSGRISEFVDSRDLVLCVYESDFCPDPADCGMPALGPRIILLHELGHAWMLDEVDSGTRQQVLEASGRESWTDNDVPWGERGVEYAAQILAWGLVSDEVRLIELGEPPCAEATAVFEILTGIVPPVTRCRS